MGNYWSSPVASTRVSNTNHWDLEPFASDQISDDHRYPWFVTCEDDARRRQLLWYLFSQSRHKYDNAVLFSTDEDTISYFDECCPGVLVCRDKIPTPQPMGTPLHKVAQFLIEQAMRCIPPCTKRRVGIILDETHISPGLAIHLSLCCSDISKEQSFTVYHGARSCHEIRSCGANQVIVPTMREPGRSVSLQAIATMRRHSRLEPMTPVEMDSCLESITADSSLIRGLVLPALPDDPVSVISLAHDRLD